MIEFPVEIVTTITSYVQNYLDHKTIAENQTLIS